ncbi:MAG: rhomboid family intramembrane serine protease [Flavobacterium sp.]
MMRMTETVKQLLIINIIFFIGSNFIGDVAYQLLSMHYPANSNFRFWQPITHMFMHAPVYLPQSSSNLMHLVFNMFALVSFGSVLEQFWGAKKFLFFYFSCGIGALLVHLGVSYYEIHSVMDQVSSLHLSESQWNIILNTDYASIFDENGKMVSGQVKTILENAHCTQEQFNIISEAMSISRSTILGASGAIYGLLIAFAFMFPNAELGLMFIPIPIKAKYFVPIYMILYDGLFGIFGGSIGISSNVAHFAHIGGALTGFIMMWYWKKNQFRNNRWDK